MKTAWLAIAWLALAPVTTFAQGSKSCPLMDLADASHLAGKGTELYSVIEGAPGAEGKKSVVCSFGVGDARTLTVKVGPSLAKSAADYQKMHEPLRTMNKDSVEAGIGEYAHSKAERGEASLTAVKGTQALTLEVKGKDVGAGDLDKLRAAARKALAKL